MFQHRPKITPSFPKTPITPATHGVFSSDLPDLLLPYLIRLLGTTWNSHSSQDSELLTADVTNFLPTASQLLLDPSLWQGPQTAQSVLLFLSFHIQVVPGLLAQHLIQ